MRLIICLALCLAGFAAHAQEGWQAALSRMPLGTKVTELNRTNCVKILLPALQSNDVVKALVFMPGATDEFYMFRRARAVLTNANPSLLDAVTALTNQTLIKATFHPPMLLLHTDEDPLEPLVTIKDPATAAKLERKKFLPHVVYNDRDYDYLLPVLWKNPGLNFTPQLHMPASWHFYRNSFAAWNLTDREALDAMALAGKMTYTISKGRVIFEGDVRVMAVPKFDHFPE